MFDLITDPQHKIPQNAPDGNYCPANNILGDLNNDSLVNILDIINIVNIVLSNEYSDIADLNQDQENNILDIIFLVNIILSK